MVERPFEPSALSFVISSPILRVCRGHIILDPDLGFSPGVGLHFSELAPGLHTRHQALNL
jgi:hypothetical protein